MTEKPLPDPESAISSVQLGPIRMDEISSLVDESNGAFLAPASDPTQTTEKLLQEMRQDPRYEQLGYKVNGMPISYIIALSHKDPLTISIGPMYVAAQFQGRGLGRKQVDDFIDHARTLGYKKIFTKTWLENNGSRKIFESVGFTETGIKSGDRANGDSTIGYLLEL